MARAMDPNAADWTPAIRSRLAPLQLSPVREAEIIEELSQHLDDRRRELIAGGATPDEATRLALDEFRPGDILASAMAPLRQSHAPSPITPGARAERLLAEPLRSLRYAARVLLRQPLFTAVAVITLALGIGATTAIFSVVYGVLLKPLPFEQPDRLVALYHFMPGYAPGPRGPQSPATYFTYRDNNRVFEDVAVWRVEPVSIARRDGADTELALRITDGLLPLLRVRPLVGDLIRKDDDLPGAPNRVLLTYGYWLRAFGAAPEVVGTSLTINSQPHEIAGVLPASFKFLDTKAQMLLPMRLDRAQTMTGGGFGLRGVARLKSGVTILQANDDIARMIPLMTDLFPLPAALTREMWAGVGLAPNVQPLADEVIGDVGRSLWVLLGAVGVVLLMASANVTNLLLARVEARRREFAVRAALGASRGRLGLTLFSESLLLALAGGALGLVFAEAGLGVLRRIAPVRLPRVDDIGVDGTVLLFTTVISIATALMLGVLPAVRFRTLNVQALKDAGGSASDAPGRQRTQNALVVTQVAFALVLLIVSALMIRTFFELLQVRPGFVRPEEVQTFRVRIPPALIADLQPVIHTYQQITERLQQVPGVVSVGSAASIAMDRAAGLGPVWVEGQPVPGTPPSRRGKSTGPGYFETMGNPVLAGRTIEWRDLFALNAVVVVSENLAREYWGEPANAIGKRLGGMPGEWFEIVGVVGDERIDGLSQPAPAIVYWPMAATMGGDTSANRNMAFVVRSPRVGQAGFLHELEQAVRSVNRNLALGTIQTLDRLQADSMAQTSFAMVMLAVAAMVALLLALVGIYGVVAYIATQRTHEIGIRMALGARSNDVCGLFLRRGLALTVVGIASGLGAAMLVTPAMAALLYGVGPADPITYAGVAIVLAAVTLGATYLPARRASRVEPLVALRSRT
jgi:predicted permease